MAKPTAAVAPPRTRSAAPQNADAARILREVRERTHGAQKGFKPEFGEPTFRGPRAVVLRLGGATCAIPAGSQISVGTNPKAPTAIVLDAEKLVHFLILQDGRVMEITNLPQPDVDRVQRKAFASQT